MNPVVNYTQEDVQRPHKTRLLENSAFSFIFAMIFGLELGAARKATGKSIIEVIFSGAFQDQLSGNNFFKIWPNDFATIAICLGFWAFYFAYEWNIFQKEKNVDLTSAHGTGGFEDNIKKFYHDYVLSPLYVGKGPHDRRINGKLSSSKIDCFTGKSELGGKIYYKWCEYIYGWISFIAFTCLSILARNKTLFIIGILISVLFGILSAFIAKATHKLMTKKEIENAKMNSQILSKDVMLSLDCNYTMRNLNTFFFGASGTGKSRFAVKPNILQANSSYVITDPSAELVNAEGAWLKSQGYKVRILNLKDMTKSCRYNPFEYVTSEDDIPALMKCLKNNLDQGKSGGGDSQFWDQSTMALLTACSSYLFEVFNEDEEFLLDENGNKIQMTDKQGQPEFLTTLNLQTFDSETFKDQNDNKVPNYVRNPRWKGHRNLTNVMNMLRMGKIVEDGNNDVPNDLDVLFNDWEAENPKSYAVKQYKTFKMAPSKTALNIMISVSVLLGTYFDLDAVIDLTHVDEMDIKDIGEEKTAIFLILPEGGSNPFAFISAMFYSQLFSVLYKEGEDRAEKEKLGAPELKIPVRIFFDEMANIGAIPDFSERLATMRKYKISADPIFQSLNQLKTVYEKEYGAIIENCDSMVFLGGSGAETLKMLSDKLGKETLNTMSFGESKSKGTSNSRNIQQIARNVLDPNEIEGMLNDHSLVFLRGSRPWYTNKYILESHPNYKDSLKYDGKLTSKDFQLTYIPENIDATMMYAPSDARYEAPVYKGNRYKISGKIENVDSVISKEGMEALQQKREENPIKKEETVLKSSKVTTLSEDEQKRLSDEIQDMKNTGICLPPETLLGIVSDPDKKINVVSGYSPDYEFKDDDFSEKSVLDEILNNTETSDNTEESEDATPVIKEEKPEDLEDPDEAPLPF